MTIEDRTPIPVTVWSSGGDTPIGKHYQLVDGKVVSSTRGDTYNGRVSVKGVGGPEDLIALWESCTAKDSLTLGKPVELAVDRSMGITTIGNPQAGCIPRSTTNLRFPDGETYLLIDIDSKVSPIAHLLQTPEGVLDRVRRIIPDLEELEYVLFPSSSNGLLLPDGTPAQPSGWHIFIRFAKGSFVRETMAMLLARSYQHGMGWPLVATNGQIQPRGLVDIALANVNQPIFPGSAATASEPLRFAKPEPVFNHGRAMQPIKLDTSVLATARQMFEEQATDPEIMALSQSIGAEHEAKERQKYIDKGMTPEEAARLVASFTTEIVELDDNHILTLNDGSTITVAEMLGQPTRYNNQYMRDPAEPDCGTSKAIAKLKPRPGKGNEPPVVVSFAHGGAAAFTNGRYSKPSKVYRFKRYACFYTGKGVELKMLLGVGQSSNEPIITLKEASEKVRAGCDAFWHTVLHHEGYQTFTVNGDVVRFPARAVGLVGTGVGKTSLMRAQTAKFARWVRDGSLERQPVVFAMPRHNLNDETKEEFAKEHPEVTVEVYKGRSQEVDPKDPDSKERMCLRWEEAEAVQEAGLNVSQRLCGDPSNGTACPLYDLCKYNQQLTKIPDVWCVPHIMLQSKPPACIGEAAALFVDEDPIAALMPTAVTLKLEDITIGNAQLPDSHAIQHTLSAVRGALLNQSDQMSLPKDDHAPALADVPSAKRLGLDVEELGKCRSALYKGITEPQFTPNSDEELVKAECKRIGRWNKHLLNLSTLLGQLIKKPSKSLKTCPGLELVYEDTESNGLVKKIRIYNFQGVHGDWLGMPTMLMSATAHHDLISKVWPSMDLCENKVEARRVAMPHVRVRQVVNRSMGKSNLKDAKMKTRLVNYIRKRASQYRKVLVIMQKGPKDEMFPEIAGKRALPENVSVEHFNNISGLDKYGNVDLIIIIGRTQPPPEVVERMAAVIAHTDVAHLPDQKYPLRKNFLQIKGDHDIGVSLGRNEFLQDGGFAERYGTEHHPDALAEAVRWTICVGELIQAIGRGRGVHRKAANPLQVDVLTNQDVGMVLDEIGTFEHFECSAFERLVLAGLVPCDLKGAGPLISTLQQELFSGGKAVQDAIARNTSVERDLTPTTGALPHGLALGITEPDRHIRRSLYTEWPTIEVQQVSGANWVRCYVDAYEAEAAVGLVNDIFMGIPDVAFPSLRNFKVPEEKRIGIASEVAGLLAQEKEPLWSDVRAKLWCGKVLMDKMQITKEQAQSVILELHSTGVLVQSKAKSKDWKMRPAFEFQAKT